ncbi:nuclear receptor NHR-61 [Aphelenchoides avenae]|nr:nuclear receptor NHR-61 [Aphelenchus avenae]
MTVEAFLPLDVKHIVVDSPTALILETKPFLSEPSTSCSICGDLALGVNFGVRSCNACAAFFRRSVVQQRNYVCRRGKKCNVQIDNRRCRYCRLQRCFEFGMNVNAVSPPAAGSPCDTSESPLHKLVTSWKKRVYNRVVYTANVYGNEKSVQMANRQRTGASCAKAWLAEPWVILEFISSTDLIDHIPHSVSEEQFVKCVLYRWITFGCIINTARNMGFLANKSYFVDESTLSLCESDVHGYYRTHPGVLNTETIAGISMNFYKEKELASRRFYEARFDDTEQAVLAQLMLVKCAADEFGWDGFKPLVSSLFDELKEHYSGTYSDFAVRLGEIVMFLHEIERVHRTWDELRQLVRLNSVPQDVNQLDEDERCYASKCHERWTMDKSTRTLRMTL